MTKRSNIVKSSYGVYKCLGCGLWKCPCRAQTVWRQEYGSCQKTAKPFKPKDRYDYYKCPKCWRTIFDGSGCKCTRCGRKVFQKSVGERPALIGSERPQAYNEIRFIGNNYNAIKRGGPYGKFYVCYHSNKYRVEVSNSEMKSRPNIPNSKIKIVQFDPRIEVGIAKSSIEQSIKPVVMRKQVMKKKQSTQNSKGAKNSKKQEQTKEVSDLNTDFRYTLYDYFLKYPSSPVYGLENNPEAIKPGYSTMSRRLKIHKSKAQIRTTEQQIALEIQNSFKYFVRNEGLTMNSGLGLKTLKIRNKEKYRNRNK